jgi:hypothetical protein
VRGNNLDLENELRSFVKRAEEVVECCHRYHTCGRLPSTV